MPHHIEYFDRIEGLYWFCVDHHGGLGCVLYRYLCILQSGLGFCPGRLLNGPSTEGAREYYTILEERGDVWYR